MLAAGASSRMGKPKQLLPYNGKNLLQHAVQEAANSNAAPVIVVLGANAGMLAKVIDEKNVCVIENMEWEEGMASSVRWGLNTLLKVEPEIDAVIFMVCDQPYISSSLLNDLIATQLKTGKLIVTSSYGASIGPPALFHKHIFPELLQLKGDIGARKIIQQNSHKVAAVFFPKGNVDIDTKEDYEALKNL